MTQPTPAATPPASSAPPAAPAPAPDPPTPAADPAADPPDAGPTFASDRDRRRWAELTGRVGKFARERDEARARVEALQWREVERLAGATLAVPADIRIEAPELADLLDPDSGDVDAARVAAVVTMLVEQRPGLRRPPAPTPLPGGHRLPPSGGPPTLADAVQRIARGRGG